MKMKRTEVAVIRPGEGTPMAITRPLAGPSKASQMTVSMATAEVPARRYTCDVVDVIQTDLEVQLLFGQRKVGGGSLSLRSLLVLHLSLDGVSAFLRSVEKYDIWVADLSKQGIIAYGLTNITDEPIQTHSLNANYIVAGLAGREACMDFYLSSAFVFAALSNPNATHMPIDPVVRVSLPTALFLSVVDKLRVIGAKLPQLQGEKND